MQLNHCYSSRSDEADPGRSATRRTSFWDKPKTPSTGEIGSRTPETAFVNATKSAPAGLDRPLLSREDKALGEASGNQESGCQIA